MSKVFIAIGNIGFLIVFASVVMLSISFETEIGGHLKRAADSNQPETALKELDTALRGMDRRGFDTCTPGKCFTSIIYRTPDEDIGFWYQNIKSARDDLRALPRDADQLMISNSLMKLRETLLDNTDSGDEVTLPRGISRYPNNGMVGFFIALFLAMFFGGFLVNHPWIRSARGW